MDTGVLVVGAGPTGLMLTAELALAGIPVRVVERQAVSSGQSRGGGVSARTAEVFALRGLIDELTDRAVRREPAGNHFAGLPVVLDNRPLNTRYPGGLFVPQDRIETVLEEHLAQWLGVKVRRSTTVTGLVADDDGVTVTLDSEESLRAQYVVACDGAHSTVRGLLDVPFPGQPGTGKAITADIELSSRSDTVPRRMAHISKMSRRTDDVFMLLHPLFGADEDNGPYRVVFGGPDQLNTPRDAAVSLAEVQRALTTVHGPDTVIGRVRSATRFSDATRQVENYRHGRVFFAGDAAHIHAPIGGQGLNLGVQDAMNLGWKLAAHIHGTAAPGLLDTYNAERHPIAARVLTLTKAQRLIMTPGPDDHDAWAMRDVLTGLLQVPEANRYLAGIMSGVDIRYDLGSDDPLVGQRMSDLDLRTADGPTRVSALLHKGNWLLLDLADLPPVTLPPQVHHVVAETDAGTAVGADRVLVRPDGYVAAVGTPDLTQWFA
jgi:2-polyprenyl-6-methoxyphenol hydroxylase-like FAD-dependent oxidoreductase